MNGQARTVQKKSRSSNLELYRIICMLMIVAHHYVVNSGLRSEGAPLMMDLTSGNSIFLTLFGAWGKTGINCFLMITGYYMCASQITLRKLVKLLAQILFYNIVIFLLFYAAGYECLSIKRMLKVIIPFWGFKDGFVSCFIIFYLTIPFWNILIKNMTKRQHQLLLILVFSSYTIFGSIPEFVIRFNYITWFGFIYLIASYIRVYPHMVFSKKNLWKLLTIINIILASLSICILQRLSQNSYFFVIDCNKLFAVSIAICSFLWFKNINLKYSKVINAFGAGTFGVLLIHANSNAMRTWLWIEKLDVIGHFSLPLERLILYSIAVVIAIFIICNLIDQLRMATVEKWLFCWYDEKLSNNADAWIKKLTRND